MEDDEAPPLVDVEAVLEPSKTPTDMPNKEVPRRVPITIITGL